MDDELLTRFRNFFIFQHRFILVIYFVINILVYFVYKNSQSAQYMQHLNRGLIVTSVAIILIMIINGRGILKKRFHSCVANILALGIISARAIDFDNAYLKMIITIIILFIMMEFSILNEFDDDDRVLFLVGITSAFALLFIGYISFETTTSVDILYGIVYFMLLLLMMNVFMKSHSVIISFYEQIVFSKGRLLEDVNSANDRLVENQARINRANELLGTQKIKLEAAYNRINQINSEMMTMNNIISSINKIKNINELMDMIITSLTSEIKMDLCGFVIEKDAVNNNDVIVKLKTGYSQEFCESFERFMIDGTKDSTETEDEIIVDNQVNAASYAGLKTSLIGSMLIIPLKQNNKIIGRMYVGNSKYNCFTEDISFYSSIVAQFLIGINNIQMIGRLEDLAIKDGLTGIFNRRYLNIMAGEWISETDTDEGKNTRLTSVLFDIDRFKSVNDNYGHMFGDVVIKGIADIINESISGMDDILFARYGGEEFVILFKNKDFNEVCELVEQLHQKIKSRRFRHNSKDIYIDVSIGISSYPDTCKVAQNVLNRSDWAMYYSKKTGRGKITIDNPEVDKYIK